MCAFERSEKGMEFYMSKLKGLWIPAEILLNGELSDKEKIILAIILYLSEETKSCFASNKYIANIVNVTHERVSKIISSLKDKGYVSVKLKYKTDSKEIEERQILPIVENINRYSQKYLESIGINNDLDSQKQLYPIGDNDKDIINNIKNKNNYNKENTHKKKNIPYRSDRNYDDFNWDSLYANYKEISATSNV